MFKGLRNAFRPSSSKLWEEAAKQRQKYTPDLSWLAQKETHLLFVYDGMKKGFPQNCILNSSPYVCPGMTAKEDYVMWLRPDQDKNIRVLVSKGTEPDPSDHCEYPGSPWPGNIKGQVFQVHTEDLFDLDVVLQNRVYFQRRRIDVRLPWRGESWVKRYNPDPRKRWVRADEPQTIRAFTYIVHQDIIKEENNNIVRARRFNPARRFFNQHEVNITRYYEYTHLDK